MVTIDLRHVKTAAEAEAAMKGGLQGVPTPRELACWTAAEGRLADAHDPVWDSTARNHYCRRCGAWRGSRRWPEGVWE